jgi:hypothetical protein
MIMPTSYLANWKRIQQQKQHSTDMSTIRENATRIKHIYKAGDKVLLISDKLSSKLAPAHTGPIKIVDPSKQQINGTVKIRRSPNIVETINIRRLRPFRSDEDADAVTD